MVYSGLRGLSSVLIDRLILTADQRLFYADKLENRVHCTFIFTFSAWLLRKAFLGTGY